jgi:hypothetical protein
MLVWELVQEWVSQWAQELVQGWVSQLVQGWAWRLGTEWELVWEPVLEMEMEQP